jgi:hypothetical protein
VRTTREVWGMKLLDNANATTLQSPRDGSRDIPREKSRVPSRGVKNHVDTKTCLVFALEDV